MSNQSFSGLPIQPPGDLLRFRANLNLEEETVGDLANLMTFSSDEPQSSPSPALFIQTQIPALWDLACSINDALHGGVTALVIENLPFARFNLRISKLALLAFASCIGRPIGADYYRGDLVWPVSPKPELPPAYTPTITEH
ncbi:MAG TPA: hypothetical protein VN844_01560, partial [Pyrinomonadaceae bacterium]|nr:hypothetical protein [Pyrinomonadaceae bacterium]